MRETLVKILQETEIYEAHMADFQAQIYEALAADVTFTDKGMLLCHNRPLHIYEGTTQWQQIVLYPGRSGGIYQYNTL